MAAVRVERTALSDPRMKLLAQLLGCDAFSCLGRMIHVWAYCTDQQAYSVSANLLDAMTEIADFGEALVKAGLAEGNLEQGYRIRGTEGRIEWLGKLRESASAGGRARASAARDEKGRLLPGSSHMAGEHPAVVQPSSSQLSSVTAPSPAPVLAPVQKNINISARTRVKQPDQVTREDVDQGIDAWLATLKHFGMGRTNVLANEDYRIASAMTQHGIKPTIFAIEGARYQQSGKTFDPKQFLSLDVILGPKSFTRLMNLGLEAHNRADAKESGEAYKRIMTRVADLPPLPGEEP